MVLKDVSNVENLITGRLSVPTVTVVAEVGGVVREVGDEHGAEGDRRDEGIVLPLFQFSIRYPSWAYQRIRIGL